LGIEDTSGREHTHEAAQAGDLAGRDHSSGGYLGEGGAASMVLDGLGDAEVYGSFEAHGLDIGKCVLPEVKLSVKQGLACERHDSWLLLPFSIVVSHP
jgi:hypothetical protein